MKYLELEDANITIYDYIHDNADNFESIATYWKMVKVILDCVVKFAKAVRYIESHDAGIQWVFVGDFYQLQPVNGNQFIFQSQSWLDIISGDDAFDLS